MTYMAGLNGSFILECSGYAGVGGNIDFVKNENVYFLGVSEVTNRSAESIGFPGYFFIDESPAACVDLFDIPNNNLHLVQAVSASVEFIFPPRNRGFIRGDIVVGGISGAVRSVGKNFKLYDGFERCSIKEFAYNKTRHDLLNFPDDLNYNRSQPFNNNFYSDTDFSNFDNKFCCLSVRDRYALPVPYTANKFGFQLACAVTRQHVIIADHVVPYSSNIFSFYDPVNANIVVRNVVEYKGLNSIVKNAFTSGLFGDNTYKDGDIAIGLLDSPLPERCVLANIPSYVDIGSYPHHIGINGIMICADYRGYFMNYVNRENSNMYVGSINQYSLSQAESGTHSMFGAIGDSNSMIFAKSQSDLIFCGPVYQVFNNLAGLGGNYRGLNGGSRFDFEFYVYPDSNGVLTNRPSNRYRRCVYNSSLHSLISIKDNLLEYVFTSPSVWEQPVNTSFIPNRKIMNDFINIELSFDNSISISSYKDNKLKYING